MPFRLFLFLTLVLFANPALAQNALTGQAAALYQEAMETGRFASQAAALKPDIHPTSDGLSYYLVWKPVAKPARWIVSLHGAGNPAKGFATDDLALWYPHIKDRDVGIICMQWWLGTGSGMKDFYAPPQLYREIDRALQAEGVAPRTVMLHGFSRGSSNTYALAAIDAGRGKHYFSLNVASSGGVSLDYPPNQAITEGLFGDHPLQGTRWITAAGARDPHADRDGIEGMRKTADWLKAQGAIILAAIEDPTEGHGALVRNPANAKQVLDIFLK